MFIKQDFKMLHQKRMYDWVIASKKANVRHYFTCKQEEPYKSFMIPIDLYKENEGIFFSLIYST
jgi:hypothetical protein